MLTTLLFLRPRTFSSVTLFTAWKPQLPMTCTVTRSIGTSPESRSQEFDKDGMPKDTETVKHFISTKEEDNHSQAYLMPHPIWSKEEAEGVKITHEKPLGFTDNAAYLTVKTMRRSFDLLSGYTVGKHLHTLDERAVVNRCIFLETVAGVPGFTAAMVRHLHSLRRMERDHGWIHTLIEEAENERMHLMTFLQLRKPGPLFRMAVMFTQFMFTGAFFLTYQVSPKFCHRLVGYLEEEAVVTYTDIIKMIDSGHLPMWKGLSAPDIAVTYWELGQTATMKDVILAVRADEAHHRKVNHTLASLAKQKTSTNPFKKGD